MESDLDRINAASKGFGRLFTTMILDICYAISTLCTYRANHHGIPLWHTVHVCVLGQELLLSTLPLPNSSKESNAMDQGGHLVLQRLDRQCNRGFIENDDEWVYVINIFRWASKSRFSSSIFSSCLSFSSPSSSCSDLCPFFLLCYLFISGVISGK